MSQTVPLSTAIVISLLSGFVGALLPLVITPYYNHRKKLYARIIQHANSLVLLELRLLDIGSTMHDNMLALKSIDEKASKGHLTMVKLLPLLLEDDFFKDNYVKELSKRLFDFRYDLRRINNDINNFDRVYLILGNATLVGDITDAQLQKQLGGLLIDKNTLLNGFDRLMKQSDRLLGYVRARQDKDKIKLMRYRSWIIQRRVKEVTEEEVDEKVKQHHQDIEDDRKNNPK